MQNWTKALMLSAATVALSLSSCGDKKSTTPDTPAKPDTPAVKELSAEKMAELGFFNHLPADTCIAIASYETDQLWQKIRSSKTVTEIAKNHGFPTSPEGTPVVLPQEQVILNLMGSEIVFAQFGSTVEDYKKAGDAYIKLFGEIQKISNAFLMDNEPSSSEEQLMKLVEEFIPNIEVPPTVLAIKNGEDSYKLVKSTFDTQLTPFVQSSNGFFTPLTHNVSDGQVFTGYAIDGDKFSAIEGIEDKIDDANKYEVIIKALKGKKACILLGRIGEYSTIFVGKTPDDLKLATDQKDSLAASASMLPAGDYEGKKAAFSGYCSEELIKLTFDLGKEASTLALKGYKDQATILVERLNLNDQDDKLLNRINSFFDKYEQLSTYYYSAAPSAQFMYGWWDKGLNIDTKTATATLKNFYDTETPLTFSGAMNSPSTALFFEMKISDSYWSKSVDFMIEGGELIGLALENASSSPLVAELNPMIPMIAQMVLPTLNTMAGETKKIIKDGVGNDFALIINNVPEGSPIPVSSSSLFSVVSKEKTKEGLDGILAAARQLGSGPQLAQQWDMLPSLKTDTVNVGGEDMLRYALEPSPMLQNITPGVLVSDKRFIKSSSIDTAQALAQATEKADESKKAFLFKLNIPELVKIVTPLADDEEITPILDALQSDLKSIESDTTIEGEQATFSFRIVTE